MIPTQLQEKEFRFILLNKKSKVPIEEEWQTKNNYAFDDAKLQKHISAGGNYGVVSGYGDLRIIDIDDEETGKDLLKKLDTFTIRTGSRQGYHFYIISPYKTNHVFTEGKGELRCDRYQVVGPNSIHPSGNAYETINDNIIKQLDEKQLMQIVAHLLINKIEDEKHQIDAEKEWIETNIFPTLNPLILELINTNLNKETLQKLGYGSRSERDQKVVINLLLKGWGKYIKAIFDKFPVGDKYREHPDGDKYLKFSISEGRRFSGVQEDLYVQLEQEIEITDSRLLRRKLQNILTRVNQLSDDLLKEFLISDLAYKIKMAKTKIELELEKINTSNEQKTFSLNDLLKRDYPEPEYWLKPILPKNSVVILGGNPGSGKSLFLLGQMLHLVLNKDFITFHNSNGTPKVLYYDLENSESMIARRIKTIATGSDLDFANFKPESFLIKQNFDSSNKYKKELQNCENYDIVVLDSYRRFIEGDEKESDIAHKFYNLFLKKLKDKNKTVVIIHHFRKQQLEDESEDAIQKAFRGSGDIIAEPEIALAVFKRFELIDDIQNTIYLNICKGKVRDTYPIKDFLVKVEWKKDTNGTTYKFESFGKKKKIVSPKEKAKQDIVKFLKQGDHKRSEIMEYMNKVSTYTESNIDVILKELKDDGVIDTNVYGVYTLSSDQKEKESNETFETGAQKKL